MLDFKLVSWGQWVKLGFSLSSLKQASRIYLSASQFCISWGIEALMGRMTIWLHLSLIQELPKVDGMRPREPISQLRPTSWPSSVLICSSRDNKNASFECPWSLKSWLFVLKVKLLFFLDLKVLNLWHLASHSLSGKGDGIFESGKDSYSAKGVLH